MKKIFITIVCAMMALTTMAQDSDWGKFYFGVRAGLNMGYMRENPGTSWSYQTDSKSGFNIGVVAGIPVFKKYLYLEPGVYFTQKGAKVWVTDGCWYDWWTDEEFCDERVAQRFLPYYVEIPVLVSAHIPVAQGMGEVQINVGPYFAFGVGGYIKDYDADGHYKQYDFFGSDSLLKTFDCGISMGVSFLAAKHYWIGYQYELGLTNLYKKGSGSKDKLYNSNNMINIGYNF